MAYHSEPSPANDYLANHVDKLLCSYRNLLAENLIDPSLSQESAAQFLYMAPFVVVSHGTESDPVFNYANLTAQQLFQIPWDEFVTLPSRFSADFPNQAERVRLLSDVSNQGFIRNYSGIRITKSGQRFTIQNAIIWTVMDPTGIPCGQAATFHRWRYVKD